MSLSVLHLSTVDGGGGAAIATRRLHDGLRQIGVDSAMSVLWRETADHHVRAVDPTRSYADRIKRRLDTKHLAAGMKRYSATMSPIYSPFSDDRVPGADPLRHVSLDADIVNLHWTSGLVDYRRFFARLPQETPLVWTLHDMNPMTGGCHCNLGCENFTLTCGNCPLLGSNDARDLSNQILSRKMAALAGRNAANTRIVAPSEWMAEQARRSALLSRFPVDLIPHGLDFDLFRPRPKSIARIALGLPEEGNILLFAADDPTNYLKGFDLLAEALRQLDQTLPLTLVSIGRRPPSSEFGFASVHLGYLGQPQLLALAYSAADVFVMPTRAEAFGQVVFESMACGTPVVAFDVGGVPDMVRPGLTGLLAPAEDAGALRQGLEILLADPELRERMSIACRRIVEAEYGADLQASRYRELYRHLTEDAERTR